MFPRNPFSQEIEAFEIEASSVVTVDEVLFSTHCIPLLVHTTVFRDDGVGFPVGIEKCDGACGWCRS